MVRTYRGRHASKVTEEEEDEEYLKEEEDALAGAGGTRLVSQPSCERLLDDSIEPLILLACLHAVDVRITVYSTVEVSYVLWQNDIGQCVYFTVTACTELINIYDYFSVQCLAGLSFETRMGWGVRTS